jgi:hypothetical protein
MADLCFHRLPSVALLTSALLLASTGCELVTEFDRDKIDGMSLDAGEKDSGGGGNGKIPDAGPGATDIPCDSSSDCPEPEGVCMERICNEGVCDTVNVAAGTPCDNNGGEVCNRSGTCVVPSCSDRMRDGDETGVDCGGTCEPCNNGSGCMNGKDCRSGFCREGVDPDEDAAVPSDPPGICAACRHDVNCGDIENAWCDPSQNNGTCVVGSSTSP